LVPPNYDILPANTPAPSFVYFDNPLTPGFISFKSRTWTDDKCTYGDTSSPVDYTVCLNAN